MMTLHVIGFIVYKIIAKCNANLGVHQLSIKCSEYLKQVPIHRRGVNGFSALGSLISAEERRAIR